MIRLLSVQLELEVCFLAKGLLTNAYVLRVSSLMHLPGSTIHKSRTVRAASYWKFGMAHIQLYVCRLRFVYVNLAATPPLLTTQ